MPMVFTPRMFTNALASGAAHRLDRNFSVKWTKHALAMEEATAELSSVLLDKLPQAEAATWLDRELVADDPMAVRDAGFGREVRAAQAARRQWLIAQGFADERDGAAVYRRGMLAALQRRELLRIAGQLADELGVPFTEARAGERVEGRLTRAVEMTSGRHALIERSRDFTLVPWRPVLDRHVGKTVSGIVREGGISWTLGRQRSGPNIS